MGKCPSCKAALSYVNIADVDVRATRNSWHGISYNCPLCLTILSVGIDPVALKADTITGAVAGVIDFLKKTQ
jgi:hypothetical protein